MVSDILIFRMKRIENRLYSCQAILTTTLSQNIHIKDFNSSV
jgi:hypothetical protein